MARLPPLNALKAFEAAGRHLNFRLAAEEIGVTQGAVAQQVRALEARLGVNSLAAFVNQRSSAGATATPRDSDVAPSAVTRS